MLNDVHASTNIIGAIKGHHCCEICLALAHSNQIEETRGRQNQSNLRQGFAVGMPPIIDSGWLSPSRKPKNALYKVNKTIWTNHS